jgi:hypothetical protein
MSIRNLKNPVTIRARVITTDDLDSIRQTIATHWDAGRSAISHILCKQWNWQQTNGQLKDMACRELLLRLERMGYLSLPARINEKNNCRAIPELPECYQIAHATPLTGRIDSYRKLQIAVAAEQCQRDVWDSLMDRYHYLGYTPIVGSCLKYLLYLDDQLVCCMGFGSAAWKVGCRDQHIGWTRDQRKRNLHRLANNVRFLILPWVKVTHLASKVLALSLRQLSSDWKQRFHERLLLCETFVDSSRYRGTSYRAANWRYPGQTTGSGKRGASYHQHGLIKSVFVYPLYHDFQARLCR